jgi:hypothetical protein
MRGVLGTLGGVDAMLLRPFRAPVDLVQTGLLLVLLLAIAGQWHLVLERVEL